MTPILAAAAALGLIGAIFGLVRATRNARIAATARRALEGRDERIAELQRAISDLESDLTAGRSSLASAEQMAANAVLEADEARRAGSREAEARADDLTEELRRTAADLQAARTDLEAARTEVARLETEAAVAAAATAALRAELADTTDRLEAELAEARITVEALRSETPGPEEAPSPEDDVDLAALEAAADRLIVREAEIEEMEARLAAITAARQADVERLESRIGEMEHLYVEVERRDTRIDELERAAIPDPGLATIPAADLAELKSALRIERERNVRLAVRSGSSTEMPRLDDLTAIWGIGPKIAATLEGLGISTIADLAGLDEAGVDRISTHLTVFKRRIRDDGWVAQARRILQGEPPR